MTTRTFVTLMQRLVVAGLLSTSLIAATSLAQIQVEIGPPNDFIATTQPVYFEGHAAYWFRDRWMFRDGGAWRSYREEPAFLRERRGPRYEPVRQFYGREHGGGYRRGR